jgi:hypothetical protein
MIFVLAQSLHFNMGVRASELRAQTALKQTSDALVTETGACDDDDRDVCHFIARINQHVGLFGSSLDDHSTLSCSK